MPDSLRDWQLEGQLAHFICDNVDSLDQSALHARYAKGAFSARKLDFRLHEDMALRLLATDNHPAHRTLTDFRILHL